MIVAGIDFETDSLDPETCNPTEVAVILWDARRNKILENISSLVQVPEDTAITNSHITGIDGEMLELHGWTLGEIHRMLDLRLVAADRLMAHNASFDRPILKRILRVDKPWIDTMTDIPYPESIKTRSLGYLAYEHGFLNPFPHRALFDAMTMIKIASMYDFDEILKYADSPALWIRASVSFDDKDKAKSRYYRWDPVNKFWVKQIKELNLEYEEGQADFPVDLLPGYVYKEQYL